VYDYSRSRHEQEFHAAYRRDGRELWQSMGHTRGTAPWWAAIASGEIPTLERSGIISRIFFTAPNLTAKFQIGKGRDKFVNRRMGEPDTLYQPGKFIVLRYVMISVPEAPCFDGLPHPASLGQPCYLGVWIEK
jgi:hypothetical protein